MIKTKDMVNKMKKKGKKIIRPAIFTIAGAILGFVYYMLVGCSTGSCAITSHPVVSMIYMGLIGLLLSGIFSKEGDG